MRRLSIAAALAGTSLQAAAPLPDAVPIEVFAELPGIEGARLSPDGTRIAAKIDYAGKQTLVVTPLIGGGKPNGIQNEGDINWWEWVNDEWLIAGIGDMQKIYGDEYYVSRVIAVNAASGKVNKLGWERAGLDADDVIWFATDGSPRLLLAKQTGLFNYDWYPSVWEIDASTGSQRKVVDARPDIFEWDADSSGTVRIGYIYNGGQARGMLYRQSSKDKFDWRGLPKDSDKMPPLPSVFRPDGSAVAFDEQDGRKAVFELALPSLTRGRMIFGHPRYDVDAIVLNGAGNDVDGIRLTDHRERTEWINPAIKSVQDMLDKTVGAGRAEIISWSRDRSKLIVQVGDASQAGSLYYWNTGGDRLKNIGWYSKSLKGRSLSPVKTIEYRARDGTAIEAILTLPRGRPAKALPMIVLPHGGPAARDSESYGWWVQFLAEQGYAVIQPNYRGSSGYGEKFEELGEGQWGLKMQDDLLDAIDWAAAQGLADPKRVCIAGASYGGYAAMRGAQRDEGRYRCAISFAGVSDLASMKRYDRQFLSYSGSRKYWNSQVTNFTAVSPAFHAKDFTAPILIVHGVKDKRVPVKQSRIMADALRGAGKQVVYVEQAEGDHHFSRSEDRLSFLRAMRSFLDKHNPA